MFISDYKDNFDVSLVGNQVTLVVSTPLTLDTLEAEEIYLIVRADKEYTSGGSATIVIRLPEGIFYLDLCIFNILLIYRHNRTFISNRIINWLIFIA